MKLHALNHVPYEGIGLIHDWINKNKHQLSNTYFYRVPVTPALEEFDALIIMGGPMGVNDEHLYPWLKQEKAFIKNVIYEGKKVLAICLGAQLVAWCLGSKVYPNMTNEIGWFPIMKMFGMHSWFPAFDESDKQNVLHWHGDTFDLPAGAIHLFESAACHNQAFQFEDHVMALQFHLEMNEKILRDLIAHNRDSLAGGHFIQSEYEIMNGFEQYSALNQQILFDLLDNFFG